MPIPLLTKQGRLPEGIHECALEEMAERFGTFQGSEQRPRLFARLREFIGEARSSGIFESLIVDGSFVTADPEPNDIDLVLLAAQDHDFSAELTPAQYNLLTQRRVRKRFGFDIVVVRSGSENMENAIAFFQQVRQQPGAKKGLLRIKL